MMTLEDLSKRLDTADPEALMMSRANCHAMGVSSIVLMREGTGALTRVFLAWNGHRLDTNFPNSNNYEVGIHDHRYGISLRALHGEIYNDVYEPAPDPHLGWNFHKWDFESCLEGGGSFTPKGPESLVVMGMQKLEEDEFLFLRHDQLHTIYVSSPMAAWVVHEAEVEVEKPITTLYTVDDKLPDTSKLYGTFPDPETVKKHVREFIARTRE